MVNYIWDLFTTTGNNNYRRESEGGAQCVSRCLAHWWTEQLQNWWRAGRGQCPVWDALCGETTASYETCSCQWHSMHVVDGALDLGSPQIRPEFIIYLSKRQPVKLKGDNILLTYFPASCFHTMSCNKPDNVPHHPSTSPEPERPHCWLQNSMHAVRQEHCKRKRKWPCASYKGLGSF